MCGLKIEGSLYMLSNDNLIWLPCMYRQQWTFEDTVSLLQARMLLSMPAATYCINILASMDYVALFFWLDAFAIPCPLSERSVRRQTKHAWRAELLSANEEAGREEQTASWASAGLISPNTFCHQWLSSSKRHYFWEGLQDYLKKFMQNSCLPPKASP